MDLARHRAGAVVVEAILAKDLLELFGPRIWVLIKGSRGMKMEEITAQLEE